jgi:hypothetical protein
LNKMLSSFKEIAFCSLWLSQSWEAERNFCSCSNLWLCWISVSRTLLVSSFFITTFSKLVPSQQMTLLLGKPSLAQPSNLSLYNFSIFNT